MLLSCTHNMLFFLISYCCLFLCLDDCLTESHYHVELTTSRDIMRMLAFASCAVYVMGNAFRTYEKVRYRAFVKRVGRTIRYFCVPLKYNEYCEIWNVVNYRKCCQKRILKTRTAVLRLWH